MDDITLLEQKADKQRRKLTEVDAVVTMTHERHAAAAEIESAARREYDDLAEKVAALKGQVKQLTEEGAAARKRAKAGRDDRRQAEVDLVEHEKEQAKRRKKVGQAEAALAAAQAVQDAAEAVAAPAPAKKAAAKKAPAKKAPAKKAAPAKRASTATRATAAKKATAIKRAPAKRAPARKTSTPPA